MTSDRALAPDGAQHLRAALHGARAKVLRPPPRLTVDEWADRFRRLAKGAGSTSGRWKTSKVEVARGPMRAVTEPGVRTITVMSCTQLMKSALLESVFGYFAHLDPCPILLVEPKDEAVAAFSKERIGPLVASTPVLRELVGDPRTRRADDTLTFRRFPGGFLAMVAAGSPTNLAMRPIRVTLLDEIDKYAPTKEGDPVDLAEERSATFPTNSLSVRACSPTDEHSRIAASFASSDQRRAFVACPHCGHRQTLDFFEHVRWDRTPEGDHLPDTARVFCEACGVGWTEAERLEALAGVRWFQTRPFVCCGRRHDPLRDYAQGWRDEGQPDTVSRVWRWSDEHLIGRAVCAECGALAVPNAHAGYQASKLYSPWRPVSDVARKWLLAKDDPEKRQTWFNTQLGLPHKGQSEKDVASHTLMARREVWAAEIPEGVAVLTAGADVQGNRIECEVVGWGADEESWSIAYAVLEGDPARPEVWGRLDELLTRKFLRADGRPFVVEGACIDSGYSTQDVLDFCARRLARRVWPIKGESARSGKRSPVWPGGPGHTKWRGQPGKAVMLGVNAAKDTIRSRLVITEPGPGYCHMPHDRDLVWFEQLTAETLKIEQRGGRMVRLWVPKAGRANEALDCRVYAYAALRGLIASGLALNRRADEVGARRAPLVLAGTPEADRLLAARAAVPIVETPMHRPRRERVLARFALD